MRHSLTSGILTLLRSMLRRQIMDCSSSLCYQLYRRNPRANTTCHLLLAPVNRHRRRFSPSISSQRSKEHTDSVLLQYMISGLCMSQQWRRVENKTGSICQRCRRAELLTARRHRLLRKKNSYIHIGLLLTRHVRSSKLPCKPTLSTGRALGRDYTSERVFRIDTYPEHGARPTATSIFVVKGCPSIHPTGKFDR